MILKYVKMEYTKFCNMHGKVWRYKREVLASHESFKQSAKMTVDSTDSAVYFLIIILAPHKPHKLHVVDIAVPIFVRNL